MDSCICLRAEQMTWILSQPSTSFLRHTEYNRQTDKCNRQTANTSTSSGCGYEVRNLEPIVLDTFLFKCVYHYICMFAYIMPPLPPRLITKWSQIKGQQPHSVLFSIPVPSKANCSSSQRYELYHPVCMLVIVSAGGTASLASMVMCRGLQRHGLFLCSVSRWWILLLTFDYKSNKRLTQAWLDTPEILAIWALKRLRQKIWCKFKATLGYTGKTLQEKKGKRERGLEKWLSSL